MSGDGLGTEYRSARGSAGVAIVALALSGLLSAIDVVVGIWTMGALTTPLPMETAEQIDSIAATMQMAAIPLLVLTAIAFFVWLHRAVSNARALGYAMPCSPWGAIGFWFVPCYNLVWGYKIGQELWRASVRSSRDDMTTSTSGVVAGWWLTWVAAGLLNRASLTIGRFRPTIEDLRTQTTMGIVTNVLLVISAVLAVSMIRSISAAQDRLHHGEAAQPPTTF